jgi:predicted dehydrogenase
LKDIYDFIAVCDIVPEVAKEVARLYSVKAYTNIEEMLKKEKLDVLDVVVPAEAHHVIATFAMEHGVNVICETPIAPTLKLADYMINVAKKENVKLEIAENYFRAPTERVKHKVLDMEIIGKPIRVFCINAGGGHGMSHLRLYARQEPISVVGFSKSNPVPTIRDRMLRTHTEDNWSLALIEFKNNIYGIYEYSNLTHAGALGRGNISYLGVDGTKGAIVNNDIYITKEENLLTGGKADKYEMVMFYTMVRDAKVLDRIEVNTTPKLVWENPFKKYGLPEGLISVLDELSSIANAIINDTEPEYGPRQARQDLELGLAISESNRMGNVRVSLPLTQETETEKRIHESYITKFGHSPLERDALLHVFYPRV